MIVRAFDKDLRREELLGQALSDERGYYKILYAAEQFARAEKQSADLVVRAYTAEDVLLAVSSPEVLYNAPPEVTVNLTVAAVDDGKPSEYEALGAEVRPLLEAASVQPWELNEDDITHLEHEFEGQKLVTSDRLRLFAQDAKLARETGSPIAFFYGVARVRNLLTPLTRDAFLMFETLELLAATEEAVEAEIVPATLADERDHIEALLDRLRLDRGQLVWRSFEGRLTKERTDEPVAGFSVRAVHQREGEERDLGLDVTGRQGQVTFAYLTPDDTDVLGILRLTVLDDAQEALHETEIELSTDQDERVTIEVPAAVLPQPPTKPLAELTAELHLNVPGALLKLLAQRDVATLEDIRELGGLRRVLADEDDVDQRAVELLDAHANLGVLSSDASENQRLIDAGFTNIRGVAGTTRAAFMERLRDDLGDFRAAQLHVMADAQTKVLNNVLMGLKAEHANGFASTLPGITNPRIPEWFEEHCQCEDCHSAVSPIAYLADLLDYVVTHVRAGSHDINVSDLTDLLHQPFGDLLVSCEKSEKRVRQARIAIEVLRRFLAQRYDDVLRSRHDIVPAEADYRLAAYQMLLTNLGTSYEEVRRLRLSEDEDRQALAERLGIDLPEPDPSIRLLDPLNALYLNPTEAPSDPNALTEQALEVLFGLVNTRMWRDPLSEGAKLNDVELDIVDPAERPQIVRWNFEGVEWNRNTDHNGTVFLNLRETSGPAYRLSIYRDVRRRPEDLVASGEQDASRGSVQLMSDNDSGLTGQIEIDYQSGTTDIEIVVVPYLLSWRLEHLRSLWQQQDFPPDPYTEEPAGVYSEGDLLPVVDPDLIGPDDFRIPFPEAPSGAEPQSAFDLWLVRRQWIDEQLQLLRSFGTDLVALLQNMQSAETSYRGSSYGPPWGDEVTASHLTETGEDLSRGRDVETIRKTILPRLRLPLNAFQRLVEIIQQDVADIPPDAWEELYAMLLQIKKETLFPAWRIEELDLRNGVAAADPSKKAFLSPRAFVRANREPAEGTWPPYSEPNHPLIDPDVVALEDLPEPPTGKRARELWEARQLVLTGINIDLRDERERGGPAALLTAALGNPPSGLDWDSYLPSLQERLNSHNPGTVRTAEEELAGLHLSDRDFEQLMEMRVRANPSDEDWAGVYTALTTARKERDALPATWYAEEQTDSAIQGRYWKALKARLPRWRASAEARQMWQQALVTRSQRPLIDPDVITGRHLRGFRPGLLEMHRRRSEWLRTVYLTLEIARTDSSRAPLEGFDAMLVHGLLGELSRHQRVDELRDSILALQQAQGRGDDIADRLEQLGLPQGAFSFLLRMRALLEQGEELLDEEWEQTTNILVQVRKRRAFADWRYEEHREASIALSSDFFKIPEPTVPQFPPPEPEPLPLWRATWRDRRDWEETLRLRDEQEVTVRTSFYDAVSTAEEATLPRLRDALIDGAFLGEPDTLISKSKRLEAQFLIDMRNDGCQVVTRVSQAIETLQTLLWLLRTSKLSADHFAYWRLGAINFDDDWKWIGSYAMWRAAMFVYMYPENILIPSLRSPKTQTPAFREFVDRLRADRRLTPNSARQTAETYFDYYKDVCNLDIRATCAAFARVPANSDAGEMSPDIRDRYYMFAVGTTTSHVYWSSYDPHVESQSHWEVVPGLAGLAELVGAQPYRISDDEKYIFLFAKLTRGAKSQLVFTRYDLLSARGWDLEVTPLDLPDDVTAFDTVLNQRGDEWRPRLMIRDHRTGRFYTRLINADGSDWDEEEFRILRQLHVGGFHDVALRFTKTFSVHQVEDRLILLIEQGGTAASSSSAGGPITASLFRYGNHNGEWSWYREDRFPMQTMAHGECLGSVAWREGSLVSWYIFVKGRAVPIVRIYRDDLGRLLREDSGGSVPVLARIPRYSGPWTTIVVARGRTEWGLNFYRRDTRNRLVFTTNPLHPPSILVVTYWPVTPALATPIYLLPPRSVSDGALRRGEIDRSLAANRGWRQKRTYVEEAYYFVPVQVAIRLQQQGDYLDALDWLRSVYDYTLPLGQRAIYSGWRGELSDTAYERSSDWLLDPLNPHAIALTRPGAYTRFTSTAIVRCLLDYADAEFTRDTAESIPRARLLYTDALALLETEDLSRGLSDECETIVATLRIELGYELKTADSESAHRLEDAIEELNKIGSVAALQELAGSIRVALGGTGTVEEKFRAIQEEIQAARSVPLPPPSNLSAIVKERPRKIADAHVALLSQTKVRHAVSEAAKAVGLDLAQAVAATTKNGASTLTKEMVPMLWLGGTDSHGVIDTRLAAVEVDRRFHTYQPPTPYHFCIPSNPVLNALRLRAELNLYKLRNCRNIGGMERQVDPYAAPTDAASGLPQIGSTGQIILPGTVTLQPTPYRFQTLVERAKQLAQIAAQMEFAFLSVLEKRDAEYYQLMRARQDVQLTRQGVQLQRLRVTEAEHGVTMAQLQEERARIQFDEYSRWISEGVIEAERELLAAYELTAGAERAVAEAAAFAQIAQAAVTAATADFSAAAAAFALAASATTSMFEREARRSLIDRQLAVQQAAFYASFERRVQEWELLKETSQQDLRIGAQQITLAQDHVRVVGQELKIAELQSDHAQEVVAFLSNKFTSAELYDWMSTVLEGVYSFFLQQASAVAQVAERQLAFERQEVPPAVIQVDYWDAPSDASSNDGGQARERRGLTGSGRLLQDIYTLDQYAFETDKRKLQLSKSFSLARMAPVELQRFRETGVITFATPMELFDRDFPGHYLRLVKRVRSSVIALIPPTDGIHATLTSAGLSRVVIGGDVFQTVIVRRSPESVALTSPMNATGLFELMPERHDLLLPFEGMGVDSTWEFRMPKASNLFAYSTIADLIITIDYTALSSFDYRQQIVRELDRNSSADRSFSFRQEFADQWYDLHNSGQTATPMAVRFRTRREDFPPNLENLRIRQVVLYFAKADGKNFEVPVSHLHFTKEATTVSVGGSATSIDGVISTRRGNASSWTAILNQFPVGDWELALPNTAEMRNRFGNEEIEDILFVITYSSQVPEWPV